MRGRELIAWMVAGILAGAWALTGGDLTAQEGDPDEDRADGSETVALVQELEGRIRELYRTPERGEPREPHALRDGAASGLVQGLGDPLCTYKAPAEVDTFNGEVDAGVGMAVGSDPASGWLTVLDVGRGTPAERAGLRSLDRILMVDGYGGRAATHELQDIITGPTGTAVRLLVDREGWAHPRRLHLERVHGNDVSSRGKALPGGVGYLDIPGFTGDTLEEVARHLASMEEQGMQALLLDLRGCPGGLLTTALGLAGHFLAGDPLIVRCPASIELREPESMHPSDLRDNPELEDAELLTSRRTELPLVLLVDGATSRVGEVVAGALVDHGRATTVGQPTFGRGTFQLLQPLESLESDAFLRVTIGEYLRPSGEPIHLVGIEPDFLCEADLPTWEAEAEIRRLREEGVFEEYVRGVEPDSLRDLARFDGRDAGRWPGFEAWAAGVDTDLGRDELRRGLREFARRWVEEETGEVFACDISQDRQLRRAVLVALRELGVDPGIHSEWVGLPGEFGG